MQSSASLFMFTLFTLCQGCIKLPLIQSKHAPLLLILKKHSTDKSNSDAMNSSLKLNTRFITTSKKDVGEV